MSRRGCGLDAGRGAGRQADAEGRPLADPALDLDAPPVAVDDPVHDRQPQSRPLPHVLGREERVEDPRENLGRNPGAVVPDREVKSVHDRLQQLLTGGGGWKGSPTAEVLDLLRAYPRGRFRLHVLEFCLAVYRKLSDPLYPAAVV